MTQTWFRLQHHSRTDTILDPATWQTGCWDEKYIPCPCCNGIDHGDIEDVRHGVSVCRSLDDLVDYFTGRDVDHSAEFVDQLVVVELVGEPSTDEDHDADDGAHLLLPDRIVSVQSVPAELRAVITEDEEVWV